MSDNWFNPETINKIRTYVKTRIVEIIKIGCMNRFKVKKINFEF